MSTPTIANLNRISASSLSSLLLSDKASTVAVIDVRDDDHVGGHIKGSTWIPTPQLYVRIPEITRKLADKETVIFHCSLSQQRGPTAALRYLREQREKIEKGELADRKGEGGQEVYVLDKGFVGWAQKYGKDEKLTEGYAADVWED